MCFIIKASGRKAAPRDRFGYKIVWASDRRNTSCTSPAMTRYPDRATVYAEKAVTSFRRYEFIRKVGRGSEAGIYVWLLNKWQLQKLKDYVRPGRVVIRVKLDPKEFIARGRTINTVGEVRVATYKSVYVEGPA